MESSSNNHLVKQIPTQFQTPQTLRWLPPWLLWVSTTTVLVVCAYLFEWRESRISWNIYYQITTKPPCKGNFLMQTNCTNKSSIILFYDHSGKHILFICGKHIIFILIVTYLNVLTINPIYGKTIFDKSSSSRLRIYQNIVHLIIILTYIYFNGNS